MKNRIFVNHDHCPRTKDEKEVRDAWDGARMNAIEKSPFDDLARVLTEIDNNFMLAIDQVTFDADPQPVA
jgi:hypothetical protein